MSMDYKTALVELYFTFQRQHDWNQYIPLMQKYSRLLHSLKHDVGKADSNEKLNEVIQYMVLLYKFIGYTRDAYYGRGEQDLTYMMIYIWYQYFPLPALHMLNILPQFLDIETKENLPYGSWKDIGKFCKFVKHFAGEKNPLIEYAVGLLNHQIDVDWTTWSEVQKTYEEACNNPMKLVEPVKPHPKDHISLACKWTPREGSSLSWLFDRCVIQWVRSMKPQYFKTVRDEKHFESAFKKAKREYRKMITSMSKEWDLPQIKQCAQNWKSIDPETVTSKTLHHNRRAFLNLDSKGRTRSKTMKNEDRIICADKFETFLTEKFIEENDNDRVVMYGQTECVRKTYYNSELEVFFRSVFHKSVNLVEQCYLQKIWGKLVLQTNIGTLGNYFLPIFDLSLFTTDRFYQAVGTSVLLSFVSLLGQRMIAYDTSPMWVNLEPFKNNIIDIVEHIQQIANEKHIGSNIIQSMELIIQFLVQSQTDIDNFGELVLVVISDFQDTSDFEIVHKKVVEQFHAHEIFEGKIPKIVYWNVNKSSGSGGENTIFNGVSGCFDNAIVVNGGSFSVLQYLCSTKKWEDFNDWTFFTNLLAHPRYHVLENYIHSLLSQAQTS